MKRLLAILLSGLLMLSLAACGGGDSEQSGDDPLTRDDGSAQQQTQGGTENSGDTTPDIDFGSIMAGNGATDTVWSEQDAATKQAILDAAKEDGYDASFGADGSLTIKDPETGETYVQKSDGTWTYQDAEGGEAQIGGDWPDNDFTKLLPKPDFEVSAANTDSEMFSAMFSGVTVEQIKEYAEMVKAAGFTVDPQTEDQDVMGMVMFTYTASNADGYTVNVYFAANTSSVTLEKP